jgi:hypothetical protein
MTCDREAPPSLHCLFMLASGGGLQKLWKRKKTKKAKARSETETHGVVAPPCSPEGAATAQAGARGSRDGVIAGKSGAQSVRHGPGAARRR